ncbi:MAG: hypothetical protein EPO08_04275 [Rhodospirillaceae bacterium]|nr:MAG: hypothetical protein EPO08_04275 [Rhodospirillaceae bacterium]
MIHKSMMNRNGILNAFILSALFTLASGPVMEAVADPVAALVLAEQTAIPVDASSVDVRITDTSPRDYPYVGSRAPIPYDQAIRAWAAQRFTLTGQSVNALRVTLRQGTITEKLLPITTGISGWFKKEQGAEYQGTLDVEIAVVGPNGNVLGTADAKSWASESVVENATQADKEKAWMNVTKTTFDNLDRDIIPTMRKTMAAYLR